MQKEYPQAKFEVEKKERNLFKYTLKCNGRRLFLYASHSKPDDPQHAEKYGDLAIRYIMETRVYVPQRI